MLDQGEASNGSIKNAFPFVSMPAVSQFSRLEREFAELQRQEDRRLVNFATSLRNRQKNRYIDILANESTIYPRPLTEAGKSTGHYVNGNIIDLGLPHTFVACQAPVPSGIPDFLSVLYDKKINLVVMTTRVMEDGIPKADRYWPEKEESPFMVPGTGGLVLSSDAEEPYQTNPQLHIIRRHLILQKTNEPAHKLLHVQYTGWPDHGVPQSSESLEELLRIVKVSPTTVPVFVHCSAGIGRTGTLIGAYGALVHLERKTLADKTIYEIVSAMKRARYGMVQRVEQYAVIYLTVMSRMRVNTEKLSELFNQRATNSANSTLPAAVAAARMRKNQF